MGDKIPIRNLPVATRFVN